MHEFYKPIDIPPFDENGEPNVTVIVPDSYEFTKLAAEQKYTPEVAEFIRTLQSDPLYMYLLINAVGAFEYWGANKNGDAFPEKNLLQMQESGETRDGHPRVPRYKTFEFYAMLFKHHKKTNREIDNLGEIIQAFYDHNMHRVLLIGKFHRQKDPKIAWKIEQGYPIAVSMGCKVPFDVCNICGNKSSKRTEYCDHLKNEMGKIYPDGRVVCALNTKPRFDDLSFVLLPAWKVGRVLTKVAKKTTSPEKQYFVSNFVKESLLKESDIDKEVPGFAVGDIEKLKYTEPSIAKEDLNEIAKYPLSSILSSFYLMGMQPKPQELQRFILIKTGHKDIADEFDKQGIFFNENFPHRVDFNKVAFYPDDARYEIGRILYDYIPQRSVYGDHLKHRLSKIAQQKVLVPPIEEPLVTQTSPLSTALIPLAAFFAGAFALFKLRGLNIAKVFPSFVQANRGWIPALIGGSVLLSEMAASEPPSRRYFPNVEHDKAASIFKKVHQAGKGLFSGAKWIARHPSGVIAMTALPAAYLGAGYAKAKETVTGFPVNPLLKFVERHPFVVGGLGTAGGFARYLATLKIPKI